MTYNKNMIMATEANAIIGRYTITKVFENSIFTDNNWGI